MNAKKSQFYFLLLILAGTLILSFFIIRPFLSSIIVASVFAVMFQPLHRRMLGFTRNRQGLAALSTTAIIVIFIVVPLTLIGIQILDESRQVYLSLSAGDARDSVINTFKILTDSLQGIFPGMQEVSLDIDQYFRSGLEWLLQHLGGVFSSVAKIIGNLFIFLLVLYSMLKDGVKLKGAIVALSPLPDTDDTAIFDRLELAVNSVVKGSLTIAFIQGVLVAVGFSIFGVPNAVLWGTVATVAALIPGIGTALVLTPAIAFLYLSGDVFPALGLLVWGVAAVGLIDNFLGPKLVGRGMRLHSLIVLLSIFGGIALFGPIGFLLGPLTMSLAFALLDIYTSSQRVA